MRSASGMVNHVGEKKEPVSHPPTAVTAVVAGGMPVVRDRELRASVRQIRHSYLLSSLLEM